MAETAKLTAFRMGAGFGGAGLSAVSWALPTVIPDLPLLVPVTVLCIGLVLVGCAVLPVAHEWLSRITGKLISRVILGLVAVAVLGGIGRAAYDRQYYGLQYDFCFSHRLATGIPYEPEVKYINVAPRFYNRNGFDVEIEVSEGSLRIETAASKEDTLPVKMKIRAHETGWGYLDYVKFNQPVTAPQTFTGEARYVIHYGKDPSKPLDKTMIIKGRINGAVSPDGLAGGFYFIPEGEGDAEDFIRTTCYVPPERYYVADK